LKNDVLQYDQRTRREQSVAKRVVILTSALFLVLLIWQSFSASSLHQQYQESLMDSVTDSILLEYQEYFNTLRLEIDLFQQKHNDKISQLNDTGSEASKHNYMQILNSLKKDLQDVRLFSIIDNNGLGILKHITGDFLPSCEEEVASTIENNIQEQLFLHRSKTSVHFDLLQPLLVSEANRRYFFVAFNSDVLQSLLFKYQLPHQELFLMRSDNIGKIELTTEGGNENYQKMTMTLQELDNFNYLKSIPRTRWKIAIRLSADYSSRFFVNGFIKAIAIWLLLTLIIYVFYRFQKFHAKKNFQIKQELSFRENYDNLTGLSNRPNFEKDLIVLINKTTEFTDRGIVLLIDIDQFQIINNTYGYSAGDQYLNKLSTALKDFLPEHSILSRLSNDEFAILLPNINHADAKELANSLRKFIQNSDFTPLINQTTITASIGVVILDNKQQNAQQVLSSLGQAVRLAKQKGKNRIQLYQSDDRELQRHANEMSALHELASALKENRLVLYRQLIKKLGSNKNTQMHYEVLVRLKKQTGDIVPPVDFIPAAEKHGYIKQLDHYVIATTFSAIERLENSNTDHYSINLSGQTLADKDTFEFVKNQFLQYKIDPRRICFEITETSAITHLNSALYFIEQLTNLGCYFSLDDFGSGLSSFSYLQKLPVSIIKIDGAFVRDMHINEVNRIFVENIQRTAIAMNKKTVAEFVENEEIEKLLLTIGVDFAQGYYIHKPEPWFQHDDAQEDTH